MAGAGGRACAGRSRWRVGFSGCCGGRRGVAASRRGGRGSRGIDAGFEIGGVPARTLELKTGRCQLFAERGFVAFGALGQGRIRHFLQQIFCEAASCAFIGINWHGVTAGSKCSTKPQIVCF